MTEPTTPAPSAPALTINPDAYYRVQLKRPIEWNKHRLLPRHEHIVAGRVLSVLMEQDADAIDAASAV